MKSSQSQVTFSFLFKQIFPAKFFELSEYFLISSPIAFSQPHISHFIAPLFGKAPSKLILSGLPGFTSSEVLCQAFFDPISTSRICVARTARPPSISSNPRSGSSSEMISSPNPKMFLLGLNARWCLSSISPLPRSDSRFSVAAIDEMEMEEGGWASV